MMNFFKSSLTAAILTGATALPALAEDTMIEDIKSAGEIRICTVDYAPLVAKDPRTNEYQGLYIDFVEKMAEVLAVDVKYVESSWKTFVQNLQTDKCDLSIAPAYPTASRAIQILFTNPVSEDGQAVWVRGSDGYTLLEELDQPGKVIGVRAGSANEKNARMMFSKAEIKLIVSDVQAATLMEVATNRIDAALIATMSGNNMIAKNPNLDDITTLGNPQFPSSIAWAVPKGEYHFRQFLNAFFSDLKTSGNLEEMQTKWFK